MDSEEFAQICFESIRAPERLEQIRPQSHGEHDFDIVSSSGALIGALEVTTAADAEYVKVMSAVFDEKHGRGGVASRLCEFDWFVTARPRTSIRRIRRDLDRYLAAIERAGLQEFDESSQEPAARAIRDELGVSDGKHLETREPGTHLIAPPVMSGWVDDDAVNAAVRKEAGKTDNQRKLSGLQHRERHLFVYVDISSVGAHTALGYSLLPAPVVLPERITHVWVGTPAQGHTAVVWYARNGEPWTRHVVSLLRIDIA